MGGLADRLAVIGISDQVDETLSDAPHIGWVRPIGVEGFDGTHNSLIGGGERLVKYSNTNDRFDLSVHCIIMSKSVFDDKGTHVLVRNLQKIGEFA